MVILLLGAVNAGGRARADGAFPDSMQILLPSGRPHEIVLGTNFGLILSEDDGQTWFWTCEPNPNDNAIFYQVGVAPQNRLYSALLRSGLVYSDDDACSWSPALGSLGTARATDVFPDPGNAARVFAIAAESGDGRAPQSIYVSADGGSTFGPPIFTASLSGGLLGVESALADPMTVYLASYATVTDDTMMTAIDPILVRSADGGATWSSSDLQAAIGDNPFRIIAVDPVDPLRLYLRVTQALGEQLAVSTDGGLTVTEPVGFDDTLTAFARLGSGTVLVGGLSSAGAVGFRSSDGGATFQAWPNVPHLRALAERDQKLYAAADNFVDGFAVGVSTDEGLTFRPLLTFDKVMGIKPCVQSTCSDLCDYQAGITLWPAAVCQDSTGGGDGGTRLAGKSGCSCRAAGGRSAPAAAVAALALAALGLAGRRRRRRGF
jgi:MYXO-CTERM domain-containing protein